MTLAPLAAAPPIVLAHLAASLAALALAGVMWARAKGTPSHVRLGRLWVGLMAVVALTSFWITSLTPGRWSAIHLLSVLTLIGLPLAILRRRQGRIDAHRRVMTWLTLGLVGAGAFTLLPTRLLGRVVFGP